MLQLWKGGTCELLKLLGENAATTEVLTVNWCGSVVILIFRSNLADPERDEGWCGVTVVPEMTNQHLDSNITLANWLFLRECEIAPDKGRTDLF